MTKETGVARLLLIYRGQAAVGEIIFSDSRLLQCVQALCAQKNFRAKLSRKTVLKIAARAKFCAGCDQKIRERDFYGDGFNAVQNITVFAQEIVLIFCAGVV